MKKYELLEISKILFVALEEKRNKKIFINSDAEKNYNDGFLDAIEILQDLIDIEQDF